MSVNKVILIGNVGVKPTIQYAGEMPYASFNLATNERPRRKADGTEMPEITEWHRIVMKGRDAEIAEKYIEPGTKLYIEGKLRTRTWQDRNSIKRNVTEIIVDQFDFLGRPNNSAPKPNGSE